VPGYLLDGRTQMTCPHGGQVTTRPRATRVTIDGQPPYVLADFDAPQPAVAGCAFNISGAPSPCMYLQWLMPAMRVTVDSSPVLLSSSLAMCLNAARVPQGTAIVSGHQTRVQAQ
jgi:hypothetical protein